MDNMAGFNPDQYLAGKSMTGFDPDAYIASKSGPSELESFGRGAANNFPLAPQAIAGLSKGDYSTNLADWNQKAATAKEANPVSYGAGAVTGAAAPLLIPGVGEAMEAAPLASGAALGAANAVSNTDLLKNPGEAAKQAVIGGGIGAGTAGLLGKIMPSVNGVENLANTEAVKTLNLRPGMLSHLEPDEVKDLGNLARELDLVNGDTASRVAKVQDLKGQLGQQIGSMGAGNMPSGDLTDFTTPLQEKAAELSKLYAPEAKSDMNWYLHGAKDIQQNGTTFDGLQRLKTYYGDKAFDANHQVQNQAAADVYGKIRDAMKNMIDGSPAEYQDAMTGYKHLGDIESGLTKQLGQERSGGTSGPGGFGIMGMVRRLPAAVRYPLGAAAVGTGHGIIGAGAFMPEISNAALHSNVLGAAAKALPAATQGMNQELNDYLTSLYGDSNANR